MENQTMELMVKGETKFMGIKIPIIIGGFGNNQKCVLAKDIAVIHNMETRRVNEDIKLLIKKDRIKENVHYIDLKKSIDSIDLQLDKEFLRKSANIFILSERGYASLIKYMDDDKSWEVHDDFVNNYFEMKEDIKEIKHYIRSNNRLTDKCLMNLDGQKEDEPNFTFLVNNTVRNEVERIIEIVGVKAGVIAIKSDIRESLFSQWRTRKTSFNFDQLEKITNVIARFKDFLD
jgi:hypothetical protein